MALTDKQRTHLEKRLRDERERALSSLNRSVETTSRESEEDRAGDLTNMPFHQADLGTDTMQEELDASNATRISRELAEIDAALERLYRDPQRFGICEKTGEPIPFERLDIIPWARTCNGDENH
ncbi:MAG TPA: TraR/DksA C4-type zinc finger protein [Gemmatimonadaceae bacterium]|nr:TraR/DksA C4-type zinc finger protein [Gemmatimonadaceae bacterium]